MDEQLQFDIFENDEGEEMKDEKLYSVHFSDEEPHRIHLLPNAKKEYEHIIWEGSESSDEISRNESIDEYKQNQE